MALGRIIVRSFGAVSLFLSASAFAQTTGTTAADRLNATANEPGLCFHVKLLTSADFGADGRIPKGKYLFYSSAEFPFDIELVGAGGSGGTATIGSGHPKWGAGGSSGEVKRWTGVDLPRGVYLLEVGEGGAGVTGSANWHDYPATPVSGKPGGETGIKRCISGFRILTAKGGSAGGSDSFDTNSRAGGGSDLNDPDTGEPIGHGGSGGVFQASGTDAGGWGSGGGGEGSHTGAGTRSGSGAHGYARIVRLKG